MSHLFTLRRPKVVLLLALVAGTATGCDRDLPTAFDTGPLADKKIQGTWAFAELTEDQLAKVTAAASNDEDAKIARSQAQLLGKTEVEISDKERIWREAGHETERQTYKVIKATQRRVELELGDGSREVYELEGDTLVLVDGKLRYQLKRKP